MSFPGKDLLKQFMNGIWRENPVFRLVLGMCPTLAVTTSLENGLGMGLATTTVLICSNVVISIIRGFIPVKVRIPCYIVVIATFVTAVDLLMAGFARNLHGQLGIFIPLIVVNCVILGRAEAFASKHPVALSAADGLGMGVGFALALSALGAVREIIGKGSITLWGSISWNVDIVAERSLILLILPAGGFIALGCLLALMNSIQAYMDVRKGRTPTYPAQAPDCRHCIVPCGLEFSSQEDKSS